ncbi:MAG: hypothetical protein P0107_02585 [Nitrosomonas sp.]|nr:hypothetical protein [Nitrosomonas sp.]
MQTVTADGTEPPGTWSEDLHRGESDETMLEEVSVVTAPYEMEGKIVGTVGVIGPRRMAYERIIPIVTLS